MRAKFEHLTAAYPMTWRYTQFSAAALGPFWHFHEEYELTWVPSGTGDRLVGDSIEEYRSGDLTLIGPNLPHTYISSHGSPMTTSVVIHFKRDFLGSGLLESPTFASVTRMLDDAANGIWFTASPALPTGMDTLAPAERTVELPRTLVSLSREDYVLLTTGEQPPNVGRDVAARVESMVSTIAERYQSPLTLDEIAAAAHMNASAASRLFTRGTGSTITRYLATIRINAACRLLRETDRPVSWIASESGFSNLSNFNRRFREIKRISPSEYRLRFLSRSASLPEDVLSALTGGELTPDLLQLASAKLGMSVESYRAL